MPNVSKAIEPQPVKKVNKYYINKIKWCDMIVKT